MDALQIFPVSQANANQDRSEPAEPVRDSATDCIQRQYRYWYTYNRGRAGPVEQV